VRDPGKSTPRSTSLRSATIPIPGRFIAFPVPSKIYVYAVVCRNRSVDTRE
jgi:hypothetical protein